MAQASSVTAKLSSEQRNADISLVSGQEAGHRDSRIDFMRGFACVSFITAHFEAFTWLHMLFWERLGFVSGAELFVLLSGYLIGSVHRRLYASPDGADKSIIRLWKRAGTLYASYVLLTLFVIAMARLTSLDMGAVTTFTDRSNHIVYTLIPPVGTGLGDILHNVLLLRTTPHQVQILGLYAVLLAFAPAVFVLLRRGHAGLCIALSLAAWWLNTIHPMQPTGALFENGFPLLAWQAYFYLAMVAGWHRAEILAWLAVNPGPARALWTMAAMLAFTLLLLAQSTDNPDFPAWFRLNFLSPEQFHAIHDNWFAKNSVGAGRLLGAIAFTVTFYRLLGLCWPFVTRLFGLILEPLGRSSLYVFLVHVPLIAAVDQLPRYFDDPIGYSPVTVWPRTLVLTGIIAAIWMMVRLKFLFGIIPR